MRRRHRRGRHVGRNADSANSRQLDGGPVPAANLATAGRGQQRPRSGAWWRYRCVRMKPPRSDRMRGGAGASNVPVTRAFSPCVATWLLRAITAVRRDAPRRAARTGWKPVSRGARRIARPARSGGLGYRARYRSGIAQGQLASEPSRANSQPARRTATTPRAPLPDRAISRPAATARSAARSWPSTARWCRPGSGSASASGPPSRRRSLRRGSCSGCSSHFPGPRSAS